MISGRHIASRIVWAIWAIGLGFVGYAASQSFSYTAWFAPSWIFLPLLFINFDQLLACFQRSKKLSMEAKMYDRVTNVEVYVSQSREIAGPTMDDTCVICLFDFEEGDSIRRLPCNHSFHKGCIDSFFNRQVTFAVDRVRSESQLHQRTVCPVCRHAILDRSNGDPGTKSVADV
jgi:hypothetical protein